MRYSTPKLAVESWRLQSPSLTVVIRTRNSRNPLWVRTLVIHSNPQYHVIPVVWKPDPRLRVEGVYPIEPEVFSQVSGMSHHRGGSLT